MQPARILRVAAAFTIAPLVGAAAVGFATAFLFLDPADDPRPLTALLNLGLFISVFAALIAAPTSLSIGLIVHTMFQRRGVTAAWAYILAGALTGTLVPLLMTLLDPSTSMFILYGIPAGIITALAAWLIRRPDRDEQRTA